MTEENQTQNGGSVRGVLRSAVFTQKRLPMAHAAWGVPQVENCVFVLCPVEQARPGRNQRTGAGFKKIRLAWPA